MLIRGVVSSPVRGVVDAEGEGAGGSYTKPDLIDMATEAPATAIAGAGGYTEVQMAADSVNLRLDRAMSAGKHYWEATGSSIYLVAGLTNEPTAAYAYGGLLNSKNSAVFRGSSAGLWGSRNWGTDEENLRGAGAPDDCPQIGLLFDADTRILQYRVADAAPTVSHDLSARTGPFYALFARQGAVVTEIRLGPAGCTYALPEGYEYL